jgi:hypothetical protein
MPAIHAALTTAATAATGHASLRRRRTRRRPRRNAAPRPSMRRVVTGNAWPSQIQAFIQNGKTNDMSLIG